MKPGAVSFPLMVTVSTVWLKLKVMSDTVPAGPKGGVVWFRGREQRADCERRPFVWCVVVKQVIPAVALPFLTQSNR